MSFIHIKAISLKFYWKLVDQIEAPFAYFHNVQLAPSLGKYVESLKS